MKKKEYEMPEEYKENLAKLTKFLEAREYYSKEIKDLPPHLALGANAQFRELDNQINKIEKALSKEYKEYQAGKEKEAKVSKLIDEGWESSKHLYLIIKHQKPHLLEGFTRQVLEPLPADMLEEFYDEIAILEATKLDDILTGKK